MKDAVFRPNQTQTPHFPQPAGSIHGSGWRILQTLKGSFTLHHPCATGLPHTKQRPTGPPHERTGPGPPPAQQPPPSTHSPCRHACRNDDEDTQSSRGLSGLPIPREVALGLPSTQPPTAEVEAATNLNARTLHTLAPCTPPAHSPQEEGIIKQTSQPPTTCGFHIYTNVLLEMEAQHPGTQEKASLKQNAKGD